MLALTRVLVVDDASAYGALVAHWLDDCHGVEVVGVAKSIEEALDQAATTDPDVVVLDHLLGTQASDATTPRLRQVAPAAKVLVVSGMAPDHLDRIAREAGADAALPKSSPPEAICDAIHRAVRKAPAHDARWWPEPDERILLLAGMFECFAARRWAQWESFFDRKIEWFPIDSLVDGRVYHGKEEVLGWIGHLLAGTRDFAITADLGGAEHDQARTMIEVVRTLTSKDHVVLPPQTVHSVVTFDGQRVSAIHDHADGRAARQELRGEPWRAPAPIDANGRPGLTWARR